jgi:hypothetical protein
MLRCNPKHPVNRFSHPVLMMTLDRYLSLHFITQTELAARCDLSGDELSRLIERRLVASPSYTVSGSHTITSHVFGSLRCDAARDGSYFHPATVAWVNRAVAAVEEVGEIAALDTLRRCFARNFSVALKELDSTLWRLPDCFGTDGEVVADGMLKRIGSAWEHHLHGTFGLCVAKPDSEAAIARKEIVQEKLCGLSENGARRSFSRSEAELLLELIDEYARLSMPFSPVEYPLSSRRRLVSDLRPRVLAELCRAAARESG